ncbi:GH14780 [Drosophila grimshawi]|uniref:GH14780 n=1 Tax=Drosophila grimshawi TaxID=7222 RepID=B4JUY7_DROGR|nr:GH14780 [Drosophila grimshawi]
MNCELKPTVASGKLLNLNVTSEEQSVVQAEDQPEAGQLSAEETQLLLQKLSINNPFYRFRKQSNSLRELRRLRRRRQLRRHRSETDLMAHLHTQPVPHTLQQPHQHNEAKVVVVLDSKQQLALSNSRTGIKTRSVSNLTPDNSTVITNPFSIFHDDEILTLGVNPRLRSANSSARPQRSGKGLRRLFEGNRQEATTTLKVKIYETASLQKPIKIEITKDNAPNAPAHNNYNIDDDDEYDV